MSPPRETRILETALDQAITYCLRQWKKLTPFLQDGRAVIYSITQTAKENGLKPLDYLTYLFERLPNIDITDPVQIDALLPWSETLSETCQTRSKRTRD